jgi:hypothetical protein
LGRMRRATFAAKLSDAAEGGNSAEVTGNMKMVTTGVEVPSTSEKGLQTAFRD